MCKIVTFLLQHIEHAVRGSSHVATEGAACHWRGAVTLTLTALMAPMKITVVSTFLVCHKLERRVLLQNFQKFSCYFSIFAKNGGSF